MFNEIINIENLFLIIIGLVWIVGAILQDLKRREVDNLWNFSLIIFALVYRLAVSVFSGNYWFILNGILGLAIFYVLHNLFYYGKLFAGGDAKLLMALGVILPLSYNWITNLKIFGIFILLFMVGGSIYALIWAISLVFIHWEGFSKKFIEQWKKYQKMFFIALGFSLFWVVFVFLIKQEIFILIGFVILLFPVLFVFSKSIEESCMIKFVRPSEVTEGDWLYEDITVDGKKIKSGWEGVSARELALIKRKGRRRILIKFGIPFTPSFLIGFIGLLFLVWKYSWFF